MDLLHISSWKQLCVPYYGQLQGLTTLNAAAIHGYTRRRTTILMGSYIHTTIHMGSYIHTNILMGLYINTNVHMGSYIHTTTIHMYSHG